jgi:hypothetical protein
MRRQEGWEEKEQYKEPRWWIQGGNEEGEEMRKRKKGEKGEGD